MNKSLSALFALLITLLLYSTYSVSQTPDLDNIILARVIDGDTIEDSNGIVYRLININAFEKSDSRSKPATAFLSQYINKSIKAEIQGKEKYGRVLVALYYENNYLNLNLVEQGLATTFLVNELELKEFAKAETSAVQSELGVWKHSKYYNCIIIELDAKSDKVKLTSSCNTLDITGWTIRDESRKQYIFGNLSLGSIILDSSNGKDNSSTLFWNNQGSIWNNDRDTLYIFDENNFIVSHYKYGY